MEVISIMSCKQAVKNAVIASFMINPFPKDTVPKSMYLIYFEQKWPIKCNYTEKAFFYFFD